MLVRTGRDTQRNLQDIETLLEIVASQLESPHRRGGWTPNVTKPVSRATPPVD